MERLLLVRADRAPVPPQTVSTPCARAGLGLVQAAVLGLAVLGGTARAGDPAPAASAAAAAPGATELSPVVITATRQPKPANEVPASIDSVSAADIHRQAIQTNVSEDLVSIPGVVARNRQDFAQDDQISIRGFGSRAQFGIVGIRLYMDGIPATLPDGQGATTAFNLDTASRIEVLRGPFSALYGNSSGGVIQIFTAEGTQPGDIGLTTMGGSYGTYRASFHETGATGSIHYNVGATHFSTDGYRANSHARRELINGKWTVDLSASNTFMLVLNEVSAPEARDPQGLTRAQFEANPRQAQASAVNFKTRKSLLQSQGGIVDQQALWTGANLRLSGYYGNRLVKQYLSTPVAAQASPTASGGVVDLHTPFFGGDARFTQDTSLLDGPLEFTGGISYDRENQRRRGWQNFVGVGAAQVLGVQGAPRRDEADRIYNFDQYLQVQWTPFVPFSATIGMRHDAVHFVSTDHFIVAGNPDDSGQRAFFATTPVLGLLYRVTGRLHVYASYGEGFDTPTGDELSYKPDGTSGINFALVPARTNNAEVGAKWQYRAHSWLNVATFGSMTRHEIVVDSASGGRSTYQNVGRVRRSGIEAESSVLVLDKLRWLVSYSYIDATFRTPFLTCATTSCPTVGGIVTGQVPVAARNRLPAVPENNGWMAIRWGNDLGPRFGITGQFLDRTPTNTTNAAHAPGYALMGLDAGYSWQGQHVRIDGFVRADNLLNTHYVGAVIINDTNSQFYDPGAGRSAYAGIALHWIQ